MAIKRHREHILLPGETKGGKFDPKKFKKDMPAKELAKLFDICAGRSKVPRIQPSGGPLKLKKYAPPRGQKSKKPK